MKVLTSRQLVSPSLVLYCCLILLGSPGCLARSAIQDYSASKVEEVHEELAKPSLPVVSLSVEGVKGEGEDDALKDKVLTRLTDTLGKSVKENEDLNPKDVTINRDVENEKKIVVDDTVEGSVKDSTDKQTQRTEKKSFKRLIKRPIARLKRDEPKANEEKLQVVENVSKAVEDKNSEVGANGIRRLDIDVAEESKNENLDIKSNLEDKNKNVIIEDADTLRSQEALIDLRATESSDDSIKVLSNVPTEVNTSKRVRQATPQVNFYTNPFDPDTIVINILTEQLQKNPPNNNLPSYIEAKNETLSKLLSCNRLQLLQMTEKFLPENARQGYSDEMLSCVKRFEYFSCIKYFSWPEIRKYYSALPEFPLDDAYLASLIYNNYPLIPYPGFEPGFGHLPEVVESGPTRMRPETIIMDILRNTGSYYVSIATAPTPIQWGFLDKSQSLTQEQIASIHMAEQLLPVSLRSIYVSKTAQCIRQFDYYNCIKYSSWPLLRQFNPSLPEFPNLQSILGFFNIPDIPQISNLFNFFSQFQLPQFPLPQFPNFPFPNISSIFPGFGQQTTTTTSKPPVDTPPADPVSGASKKSVITIESKIYKILKDVKDSMGATPLSSPTYTNRKDFLYPLMTVEQSKIFALAESIVPPIAREPLITNVHFCLLERKDFSMCSRTVMWPYIRVYVKNIPEFPEDNNLLLQQNAGINLSIPPVMEQRDDFIMKELEKLFSDGQERPISYIIRSIQLSPIDSLNMLKMWEMLRSIQFNAPDYFNLQLIQYPRIPEFSVLSESQENIVHAVETIIPKQSIPAFDNEMINCARKNQFSVCSHNIIYPLISPYFKRTWSIPYYYITTAEEIKTLSS